LDDGLAKLAERVAESKDMDDCARKDLIEHIAVLSEESAKPPEKRKMGPLKASIAYIKGAVAAGAELLELWHTVEHALKMGGIIQG
jgi:hypothetical protein